MVEGPEGDAIFEIYEEVEEPVRDEGGSGAGAGAGAGKGDGAGAGKGDGEAVDEEMYAAMAMDVEEDMD